MSKLKKLKKIPKFKNEDQERKFWATHDTTDYFDWSKAVINPNLPNLKFSTKTITLRLPQQMYDGLKMVANKQDVPYQSLMKTILAERLKREFVRN